MIHLVLELPAVEQLRGDERRAFPDSDIEHRDDVGMIQAAGRPGFFEEPAPARRILGDVVREHLERHLARQARVPCAVHFAHSPGAEQAPDFEDADTLPGKRRFRRHDRAEF